MATLSFILNPKGNGRVAIRAKFSNGGETPLTKNLGFTIPDTKIKDQYRYWDGEKQRVKGIEEQYEINRKISNWTSRFDDYIDHCEREKIKPDFILFKRMLDDVTIEFPKVSDRTLLLVVAKEFYQDALKTMKEGTHKQYSTMVDNIEGLELATHRKYRLTDVDKDFYKAYGLYLIDTENNYNNTVNRKIGRIITLMNYAFDKKYIDTVDYKKRFTFKGSPAQRFALWPKELEILKKFKVADPYDRKVLDSFLFSCETTLRHSDVSILYPVHKKDLPVGNQFISILDLTQEKTINVNTIALTDYALMLWLNNVTTKDKRVFDIKFSNTATRIIKRLCKEAGLNRQVEMVLTQGSQLKKTVMPLHEAIGFHMARNTAITIQLSKMAPAYVKDNAGIKKMETLMGYYKDDAIARYQKTLDVMNKKATPVKKKKPQPKG